MENTALYLIDNAIEEQEGFVIDNDQKAEWALAKIREEKAEAQRLINVCNSQILFYQTELKKAQDALEQKTGYLKGKLMAYFQTVPRKASKTQETYSLPSGKLKMKFPAPEYVQDKDKLLAWLKDREMTEYIKVTESPQWGELKKSVQVAGDKVCVDGEVVEGVTAVERPPVFEVEV